MEFKNLLEERARTTSSIRYNKSLANGLNKIGMTGAASKIMNNRSQLAQAAVAKRAPGRLTSVEKSKLVSVPGLTPGMTPAQNTQRNNAISFNKENVYNPAGDRRRLGDFEAKRILNTKDTKANYMGDKFSKNLNKDSFFGKALSTGEIAQKIQNKDQGFKPGSMQVGLPERMANGFFDGAVVPKGSSSAPIAHGFDMNTINTQSPNTSFGNRHGYNLDNVSTATPAPIPGQFDQYTQPLPDYKRGQGRPLKTNVLDPDELKRIKDMTKGL